MKTKEIELSSVQRAAVETVGRNVCVSAGAGSGKTRVLVERFVYLVMEHQISPQAILAITFTEKAANEMKRRIVERLREENLEEARREVENASIGTIHAFAARLLKEHPLEAGVDPHFVILESHEAEILQERVLDGVIETLAREKEVFNLLHRFEERKVRAGILKVYRQSRNFETPFEELLKKRSPASREEWESEIRKGLAQLGDMDCAWTDVDSLLVIKSRLRAAGKQKELIRRIQERILDLASFIRENESLSEREVFIRLALQFERSYEEVKQTNRALDFDDLQLRAVKLLNSESPVSRSLRKLTQEKFREIMVDEFQDTNHLQNRLLELVGRPTNLFVVGDYKQSIYSFRGTDVQIFLKKEKTISLNENYRSRPTLIEFVNRFFETLWQEDGLPFEKLEALREEKEAGPRVERLALVEKKNESLDEIRIREARTLAQRVLALVNEGYRFGEIAILFEAMTPVHFYEQAFRQAEIPYYVVSNRGFYHQPEVRDVLSFLAALENPKRDIPLAAALRSPLFQISDETLFWLARRAKKDRAELPLAEGLWEFESIPEILEPERQKLRFFTRTFNHFLQEKEKFRISRLIETLYRTTGFDLYVLKLRQGERRYANLRKLVELAREWESKEALHLGDFVRAVKALETRDIRESQAQAEAEEGNVVRLLSIHMAKGLEFDVVVLPDLGRKERPETGNFSLTPEEGLGLGTDTLTFRRNLARTERIRSEESKRLLYVAMTRAREKLILSGPQKEVEPDISFHQMPTWADWLERIIGDGSQREPSPEWGIAAIPETPPSAFPYELKKSLAQRKSIRKCLAALEPVRMKMEPAGIEPLLQNLILPQKAYFRRIDLPVSAFLLFAQDPEAFFRRYDIGVLDEEKVTSGLELKDGEEEEVLRDETEELGSAEFGTRVHQILEQVILRRTSVREAEGLVARFTTDLSQKEREEIRDLVVRFLEGPEAKEIFEGKFVSPELPFILRLPHGLIQGTLDLIYQRKNGDWVILDYKTSRVTPETFKARAEDYRLQLELYALAAWKIMGISPAEAQVHFLRGGLTHPLFFSAGDFDRLYAEFSGLQERIIDFRKERIKETSPGRF